MSRVSFIIIVNTFPTICREQNEPVVTPSRWNGNMTDLFGRAEEGVLRNSAERANALARNVEI